MSADTANTLNRRKGEYAVGDSMEGNAVIRRDGSVFFLRGMLHQANSVGNVVKFFAGNLFQTFATLG